MKIGSIFMEGFCGDTVVLFTCCMYDTVHKKHCALLQFYYIVCMFNYLYNNNLADIQMTILHDDREWPCDDFYVKFINNSYTHTPRGLRIL